MTVIPPRYERRPRIWQSSNCAIFTSMYRRYQELLPECQVKVNAFMKVVEDKNATDEQRQSALGELADLFYPPAADEERGAIVPSRTCA